MTAEPRDVEALVPRDVEEIADLVRRVRSLPNLAAELLAREFIAARLAAADRENAELRGEVERLREGYRVVCDQAERADLLQSQLAAAQAQLAEARRECGHQRAMRQAISDEFQRYILGALVVRDRLMAARRALIGTGYFTEDEVGPDIAPRIIELHAALSAAPQPEPDENADATEDAQTDLVEGVLIHFADKLSERKAVGTASVARRIVRVLNGTAEPPASDETDRKV